MSALTVNSLALRSGLFIVGCTASFLGAVGMTVGVIVGVRRILDDINAGSKMLKALVMSIFITTLAILLANTFIKACFSQSRNFLYFS